MVGINPRDFFAAHALTGLLANPNVVTHDHNAGWSCCNYTPSQLADFATRFGEQMEFWSLERDRKQNESESRDE